MISLAHGKTSNMRSCVQTWRHCRVRSRLQQHANILIGTTIRFRSGEDDPLVRSPGRVAPHGAGGLLFG